MEIFALSFSKKGRALCERLADVLLPEHTIKTDRKGLPLSDVCRRAFEEKMPLLFIGAMGIAVRSIAPFIEDKFLDPPVVVMDEEGQFCIPLLSGHLGGANELALFIAEKTGALPVITTATDVSGAFSVDLFAKENHLVIEDRKGIRRVSGKALEGKAISLCIKDYPPKEPVDVVISDDREDGAFGTVWLGYPKSEKRYVAGIGCKSGKTSEEIGTFVCEILEKHGIKKEELYALATIDIKANEPGLLALSKKWSIPLISFEPSALNRAQGEFSGSDFVKRVTGTDNVCERAAVLAAGPGAALVIKKCAFEGVTLAVCRRKLDNNSR